MNRHYSIIDRIKICWAILSNKEFYACVVTHRYNDGSELSTNVYCYGKDTATYIKKLIESLKGDLLFYIHNKN